MRTLDDVRNAARGTISLFVVVVLTPFLTTAVLLMEAQKYNSAVSVLDEAMGVSATSVLGNYDKYLLDRWGLMALSQKVDIAEEFSSTLRANMGVLAGSTNVKKATARGVSDASLASMDVLKAQIADHAKFSGPLKVMTELLDLTDLISAITDFGNLNKLLEGVKDGLGVLKSFGELIRELKKLHDISQELEGVAKTFEPAFSSFKSAADAYVDALGTLDSITQELQDAEDAVEPKRQNVENKRAEWQRLSKQLDDMLDVEITEDEVEPVDIEQIKREIRESKEYKDLQKSVQQARNEYDEAKSAYDDVSSEVQTKRDEKQDQEQEVSAEGEKLDTERTYYSAVLSEMSKKLKDYSEQVESCKGKVTAFVNGASSTASDVISIKRANNSERIADEKFAYRERIDRSITAGETTADRRDRGIYENIINLSNTEVIETATTSARTKAIKSGAKTIEEAFNNLVKDFTKERIDSVVTGLAEVKERVDGYNTTYAQSSRTRVDEEQYRRYTRGSLGDKVRFWDIVNFVKSLPKKLGLESVIDSIKGMRHFFESVVAIKGAVDPSLDAVIDASYFNMTGFSNTTTLPAVDLSGFFGFEDTGSRLLELGLEMLFGPIVGIVNFLFNLGSFILDILQAIQTTGKDLPTLIVERLFYVSYAAYMTSCRTDNTAFGISFKAMNGYDLSKTDLPKGSLEEAAESFIYSLFHMEPDKVADTGSRQMFCGAETEYLLVGSNNELYNQISVLKSILVVRLLANIPSLMLDAETQEICSATTIGYPFLMVALIIFETIADLILLVNGQDVPFLKIKQLNASPYMSLSGLPNFIKSFISIMPLVEAEKGAIKTDLLESLKKFEKDKEGESTLQSLIDQADYEATAKAASPGEGSDKTKGYTKTLKDNLSEWKDGLFKVDYRDYCTMGLLLFVPTRTLLPRLANLIQMETRYYYDKQEAGFAFELTKAYPFIQTSVDMGVNQLMPSLTSGQLYNVRREQMRGY